MRSLPALLLFLLLPLLLRGQPADTTDQALADSLVRMDQGLFEEIDSLVRDPIPDPESERTPGRLPVGRSPKFSLLPDKRDFLGLRDGFAMMSFDRADGFFIGLGSDIPAKQFIEKRIQGYLGGGYSFGSHYWQVIGGLARDFLAREAPLRIGVEGHIYTDTRDAWKMGSTENSFMAAIAGVDARDYFQRRGFSVSAQQFLTPRTGLKGEFRWDHYRSSRREVDWSLFGPEHPYYEIPAVREGNMRSVAIGFLADYITLRSWSDPQIGFEAELEFGLDETEFTHLTLDARTKITIAEGSLWLGLHGRYGSTTGDAPPQRLFTLGGMGTLPGYPQNRFGGNRMLLIQTDLLIGPFGSLRIILENNVGAVTAAAPDEGLFAGLPEELSGFMYSPGIYLGSSTGSFRIGAAWRTDVFESPEFVVRFGQPF